MTSRSRARTFGLEEAKQTVKDVALSMRAAELKIIPTGKCRVWRKITGQVRKLEEKASIRNRYFSWRAVPVHTLTLECGHMKVVRGDNVPKKRTLCEECERALVE